MCHVKAALSGVWKHFAESFSSSRLPLPEQESAFQAADNDAKCSCICMCYFPFASEPRYPCCGR